MPRQKRIPAGHRYPGVYKVESTIGRRADLLFYIRWRRDGHLYEERAGRASQGMNASKAHHLRLERLAGKVKPRAELRAEARAARDVAAARATLDKLFEAFQRGKAGLKRPGLIASLYRRWLQPRFGAMTPDQIKPLAIDQLRADLTAAGLSPASQRHALGLLCRVVRYCARRGLCAPLPFEVELPKVDNQVTEDLSTEQIARLLAALAEDQDREAAAMMHLVLATGMRKSEALRLEWRDLDTRRALLTIRHPKSGHTHAIPLSNVAAAALAELPRAIGDPAYVFPNLACPGDRWQPTRRLRDFERRIKRALPGDFRPWHGLRHACASRLASEGVSLPTIAALLGHRSVSTTMRYSHLQDQALRKAADLAGKALGAAS